VIESYGFWLPFMVGWVLVMCVIGLVAVLLDRRK